MDRTCKHYKDCGMEYCQHGEECPEYEKKVSSRIDIRLTDTEKQQLKQQANKLGLDISGYIKLIISLDTSASIIEKLREDKVLPMINIDSIVTLKDGRKGKVIGSLTNGEYILISGKGGQATYFTEEEINT